MTKADYIASLPLPPYAMSFGGVYFENVIAGYRTLMVEGRETLASELTVIDRLKDGSLYRRKRNESRTLKVKFLIKATSFATLRTKLNALDSYLDAEQVQIIFGDESDKYYIGTKASASYDLSGQYSAVGTIEIYCADPHKYSTTVTEVTASNGEFAINYDGTYKCYPELEATANSDLGFVSYIDANKKVIQIGDPEETDTENHPKMETLIWDIFSTEDKLGTWNNNTATLESDVSTYLQQGSVKKTTKGVEVNSWSTARDVRYGPSKTKAVPADSSSHVGAANCELMWTQHFYASAVTQAQEIIVEMTGTINNTKTVIASMHITKSGTGSFTGRIYYYVMGKQKKAIEFNSAQGNKWFGQDGYNLCRIRKSGDVFTFQVLNAGVFETRVAGTEDYEITEVSFFFNRKKGVNPVALCAIDDVIFNSYSVTNYEDVPNKFMSGDKIIADCGSGKITVNGVEEYGLGALGNDWETFCLTNGVNSIQCVYSDWATTAPTFKLRYRKVYL